jgi:hypothetical protein
MAINYTTAQAASGNVQIRLTPQESSDIVFVCTSSFQTNISQTPAGWTRDGEGLFTISPGSTSPLTFDMATPVPASWTAIMLDLATDGTPAVEQSINIDFGTLPETQYIHTITTNDNDAIFWQISLFTTEAPSFSISDNRSNAYGVFQNTQFFGDLYYTSFLAVAVGCPAGSTTITFNIFNEGSNEDDTGFIVYLYTYSGIAPLPPTIFAQVVPSEITIGQSATVSWVTNFATSLDSPQLGGSIALSGSQVVTPDTSQVYQFTASGGGGTASTSIELLVSSNQASFSLQKIILTTKQDRIPVRGRNN